MIVVHGSLVSYSLKKQNLCCTRNAMWGEDIWIGLVLTVMSWFVKVLLVKNNIFIMLWNVASGMLNHYFKSAFQLLLLSDF